jgi:hypothetical protein
LVFGVQLIVHVVLEGTLEFRHCTINGYRVDEDMDRCYHVWLGITTGICD